MAILKQLQGEERAHLRQNYSIKTADGHGWRRMATDKCAISARIILLFLISMLACGPLCYVMRAQEPEYKFQAVYLFRFLQFTQWPADAFPKPETPIVIGVLGTDPFGSLLRQTVENERVHGRSIVVKRFSRVEEIHLCHALYISRSEKERLATILSKLSNGSILTVSDIDNFAEQGGAIKFFSQKGKLQFEVNITAIKNARLELSSQLLRIAKITD